MVHQSGVCVLRDAKRIVALIALSTPLFCAAAPIPCSAIEQAAATGEIARRIDEVSRSEGATAEAMQAAKQCLTNVQRAINQIAIPGVSVNIDFSGIVRTMINRACQVVTTRIDETGRVVEGTVSGAANRVIGGVNDLIPMPPGMGGPVSGGATSPGGTSGVTTNPTGGSATIPGARPSGPGGAVDNLLCRLRGTCP